MIIEDLHPIEKEILERMDEIPFGNSEFQIKKFVLCHAGDARNYRQVLLEMKEKYEALKKCEFRRRKLFIKRERAEKERLETSDDFRKRELDIEMEEVDFELLLEDKLVKDALVELNFYYNTIKSLPKMQRKEFEEMEVGYWPLRLVQKAHEEFAATGGVGAGTLEALAQLGFDPHKTAVEVRAIGIAKQEEEAKKLKETIQKRIA